MAIDERTFEGIYDEFAPKIFKFCYFRVSSKEEAEDISAQVFIRAWDHITAGKEVTNTQGFLYRIATNLVIDYYRKNKDKLETSIDDPANPIDVPDSYDFVETIDRRKAIQDIQQILKKLPDAYREIITLKYINDLSIKEIAEVMDTTENNISVRIHRATDKLKSLVS